VKGHTDVVPEITGLCLVSIGQVHRLLWLFNGITYIVYLFHRDVGFGRKAEVFGLHVDDHQYLDTGKI